MRPGRMIGGAIILLLGIAFLLMNFGILSSDFWKLWPIILIVIGGGMLLKNESWMEKKKR